MEKFLFLMARHGNTQRSDSPEYRGQSDTAEDALSDKGRRTALETAVFLSKLPLKIKTVISTDMKRTMETADIICGFLGIPEYTLTSLARPLDIGDYAGKNKSEYPIDEFLNNPDKKFPGGESVNDFNNRQFQFGDWLLNAIHDGTFEEGTVLVVAHDDVIGYWLQLQTDIPSDQYLNESPDVIKPGGVILVSDENVYPIHGRNNKRLPDSDGTALSGFVTALENRPPRECWNCKHFSRDLMTGSGQCGATLVRIDPELKSRLTTDGHVLVEDNSCCNLFANHSST